VSGQTLWPDVHKSKLEIINPEN